MQPQKETTQTQTNILVRTDALRHRIRNRNRSRISAIREVDDCSRSSAHVLHLRVVSSGRVVTELGYWVKTAQQ